MAPTIAPNAALRKAEHVAPANDRKGESVALANVLRQAIDALDWKHDAVAAAIKVTSRHFSKMLSGDKPITAKHLAALPIDIELEFLTRWCKALGLIVVSPVSEAEAREQLATGLFSLLLARAPELPARTIGPVKADLPRASVTA